jgi:ribose transport system substrate-binding protein
MLSHRVRLAVGMSFVAALLVFGIASAGAEKGARISASGVAGAKAQIAAAEKVPVFKAPGPAFDASKAKGKTIFEIPVASYLPFIANTGKAMVAVGKKIGVNVIDYPNQGQPSQWAQGVQQAIARHASLIVLQGGTDPKVLAPQIAAAKKAGIKILVVHEYTQFDAVPKNVDLSVPAPFTRAAQLLADEAIVATNGKADVLFVGDSAYQSNVDMVNVVKKQLAQYCRGCKLTFKSVPVADWATKIQGTVQTALLADSGINFVIPVFDAEQQWAIPGIIAAGARSRVASASYNGDPAVIKDILSHNIARATIGESADWLGYAYMDEALRMLTGAPVIRNLQTPVRVFDETNAKQAGTPPQWNTGYGSSYASGYLRLWGLGK